MSEVFEGYERQYCELSDNLSRKCASAATLEGEKKKQMLSEIRSGIEDGDILIRKMDLEARSVGTDVKVTLLGRLREYKTDFSNLKNEVVRASSVNRTSRVELLDSGKADAMMDSADQRGRMLMTTERLNQSTDRIKESRRAMLETEDLGVSILQDLHQQRQALLHAHTALHGVDDNISRSKKVLTAMSRRMSRNKWVMRSMIAALILAILLILYFKLIH